MKINKNDLRLLLLVNLILWMLNIATHNTFVFYAFIVGVVCQIIAVIWFYRK